MYEKAVLVQQFMAGKAPTQADEEALGEIGT